MTVFAKGSGVSLDEMSFPDNSGAAYKVTFKYPDTPVQERIFSSLAAAKHFADEVARSLAEKERDA